MPLDKTILIFKVPTITTREEYEKDPSITHVIDGNSKWLICTSGGYPVGSAFQLTWDPNFGWFIRCPYCSRNVECFEAPLSDIERVAKAIERAVHGPDHD